MEYNSFKEWFKDNLKDDASSIATHGADAGFPHITYTRDCVELFNQYQDDIWDLAVEQAEEYGSSNVLQFISEFNRNDMAESFDGLKNLMVWYACEYYAQEMENEPDEDEDDEESFVLSLYEDGEEDETSF